MRFRNEVRSFMKDMRDAFIKEETVIQEQARTILILQGQNTDLFNRLMAQDFKEFKTFTAHEVEYPKPEDATMDFESDENLAGEDVDPENL